MADTKVVPMRWPTDLLAEVDAVVERGGRTAFVLDAVRDRLAGGPLPVSEPSKREAEPEAPLPVPRSLTGGVTVRSANAANNIRGNVTSGRPAPGWSGGAVAAQKQTQGPTCPRCGGLATMQGGKAVCTQKWCK